ncbi:glycosyltransferase family 39 protein [Streptococcus dentiloxodontae]
MSSLLVQTIIYVVKYEWAEMIGVRPWVYLTLLGFIPLSILLNHLFKKITAKQLFWLLSALFLTAGLVLIVLTTDKTRDDAATVFRAAVQMNDGDFRSLFKDGYLYRYPHQLGLMSFERVILYLIPIPSMVIFFILNIFAVLTTHAMTWKIGEQLFKDEQTLKWTIFLSFAFIPQFFNVLFVYGIGYGLCLASIGLYFLLNYLKKSQLRDGIAACFFLGLSYWIRNNMIILLVAIALLLCLEALKQKKKSYVLLTIALFGFGLGMNKATGAYYQNISGQRLDGLPKIAWLAMGLQEAGHRNRQVGWYNGYVRKVYFKNHGDYKVIKKDAEKQIDIQLNKFKTNPAYALAFFRTKWLTTWTESTFQSIWSGPSQPEKQPLFDRLSRSVYNGGWGYRIIYQISHAFLILIYGGSLAYLVLKKPREFIYFYAFIYLAGGVLFHLLWETKSQYATPYVYLLIPFAAAGLCETAEAISKKLGKNTSFVSNKSEGD